MQYSKTMIDLIKEVRRRAPAEQKPAIKLANPEVMTEIKNIFHSSKDAVLRAIAKELFELAGPPWNTALKAPPIDEAAQPSGRLHRQVLSRRHTAAGACRTKRTKLQRTRAKTSLSRTGDPHLNSVDTPIASH